MRKVIEKILLISMLVSLIIGTNQNGMMISALEENNNQNKIYEVTYEKGVENETWYRHFINYDNNKLLLFSMNNAGKIYWPHISNEVGITDIPNYQEDDFKKNFKDNEMYNEFMRKLSKILFVGYPHNAKNMYKIIETGDRKVPTDEEFNSMIRVPKELAGSFPQLAHHVFKISDLNNEDKESKKHIDILKDFVNEVGKMYPNGTSQDNKLTYSDITATDFYKAASSMVLYEGNDPKKIYSVLYPGDYLVEEFQAFNATQLAICKLMNDYGIPNNDHPDLNSSNLSKKIYNYAQKGNILEEEPKEEDIKLEGSLNFDYNPKDGMWHSGKLKIVEPETYEGRYKLRLPKGVTALCDNLEYVYANEEYELISDHQPEESETFAIEAEIPWLENYKCFSPIGEKNGKKFMSMTGSKSEKTTVSKEIKGLTSNGLGSLKIECNLSSGDKKRHIEFKIEILDDKGNINNEFNGKYGNLTFNKGISDDIILKHGESKIITHLPAGTKFRVSKINKGEFDELEEFEGVIAEDEREEVIFVNRELPDITINSVLSDELKKEDENKKIVFEIEIKDKNGKNINGSYNYIGFIKHGCNTEFTKPEDGTIEFLDGKAEISLLQGQQITIRNLPYDSKYTINKKEDYGCNTLYNGSKNIPKGELSKNLIIEVVNEKRNDSNADLDNNNSSGNTNSNGNVNDSNIDRIEGNDRIETAIDASRELFPKGTNAIVLANCERFTDVLTANPFAVQENAPVLLTYKNNLPKKTLQEIDRLKAKKIYISGGYEAVSKNIIDQLSSMGYEIFRFDGKDRYDTARKIGIKIREKGNKNSVELVSGEDFPDALCMTSMAIKEKAPILLTKKDTIPMYTKKALSDWDVENIKIAGLHKAISKNVEDSIEKGFSIKEENKEDTNIYEGAKNIERIGGKDRYETAIKIASKSYPESKLGVYATGEDFPDALIAANYAGKKQAPVLLVKRDTVPEDIKKYTEKSKIEKGIIVGGEKAISEKVFNLIKSYIKR